MILTPGVLPETVSGGTAPAAPFAATPAAFAEPGTGVASTSDQARGLPVLAPPAREQPGWSARGADAFEYSSGLALVFRDRSRSAEPWLAALRGDAAGLIDPDFLLDDAGRLRDFPDAQAARSACEAELMNDQNG